ncbi:MAG: transglycosylase SLT domain-containing protein [Sulfuriferula sp.]|nr:transglycosylase SLT domain-containing protein [Sulfuriferula sp.]
MTRKQPIKSHSVALTPLADTKPEQVTVDDAARLREIRKLVEENNRSTLDTNLIICQIYMESRFDKNAGHGHDAQGLMQLQKRGIQQVLKYRKQKEIGHMPSDAQTKVAFDAGSLLHDGGQIFEESTNIQLATEYMQYWLETSNTIEDAYKNYRGRSNGIYYKRIHTCAEALKLKPESMQILRDMVK